MNDQNRATNFGKNLPTHHRAITRNENINSLFALFGIYGPVTKPVPPKLNGIFDGEGKTVLLQERTWGLDLRPFMQTTMVRGCEMTRGFYDQNIRRTPQSGKPTDEGYMYIDPLLPPNTNMFGYGVTWLPKADFEKRFRSMQNLSFGQAMYLAARGVPVCSRNNRMLYSRRSGKPIGFAVCYSHTTGSSAGIVFAGAAYHNYEREFDGEFIGQQINVSVFDALYDGWFVLSKEEYDHVFTQENIDDVRENGLDDVYQEPVGPAGVL